jgi:hypothetical protein
VSADITPLHLMSSWYAEGQLYIHSTGIRCAVCSRVTGSRYLRKVLVDVVFRNLILAVMKNNCSLLIFVV